MVVSQPPGRPSRTEVLTAFRRGALLEAARTVFGECGFERATMERIARAAGVAKGTIYLYYPSKQTIYWAALSSGLVELDEQTRARVQAAPTLRDAVTAFIATKVEYFDERRDFFRIYLSEIGSQLARPLYGHPDVKPLYTRQVRALESVIGSAVRRGEIRAVDPAQAAFAIFDLTRGLITRRLLARRRGRVQQDVAGVVDLIWGGFASNQRRTKGTGRG